MTTKQEQNHNWKVGDTVVVLNSTLSGKIIVEGTAVVTKILEGENRYNVRFTHAEAKMQGLSRERFERYVDPNAQEDPQGFCDRANAQMGSN